MDALITFSAFWTWLFVFILLDQRDSREQLEGLGAALFYSMVALTAVLLQGFWTIKARPEWWSPTWGKSGRLSASQLAWVAVALIAAMLAVGDRLTSRVFLASWLVLLYGCLLVANRYLPGKIIETVYQGRKERALLLMNGEVPEGLGEWRAYQEMIGVDCIEYLPDFSAADLAAIKRTVQEANVTQVMLMSRPKGEVASRLEEICQGAGAILWVGPGGISGV
jgi:hypothetical protein